MTTATTSAPSNERTSALAFGSNVRLTSVTKRYSGTTVVDAVNLTIEPGEFVTLLGPSGSGKTTILKMLAGFETPSSGAIEIGGREVSRLSPAERNIGMVFQNYALFPHMSVAENIGYGLRKRRWPRADRARRVKEMLELVGLEGYDSRRPQQLSGGQQQRVALARALATKPQLLLMDEPLGALDRSLRIGMSEELKRLHRETRTTFLYVTHDQEEALLLSDRVTIMRAGVIQASDDPREIFQRPPTRFVAEFFANANIIDGTTANGASDSEVEVLGQRLELATPHRASDIGAVAFHADAAQVLDGDRIESRGLLIEGRLDDVLFMGLVHQATITLRGGAKLRAHVPGPVAASMTPGDAIRLLVPAERLIALPH